MMWRTIAAIAVALAAGSTIRDSAAPAHADIPDGQLDQIFAKWNTVSTPGCAVGAAVDGKPLLAKGYGLADLEHDVPITRDSIFEAGSVSKQFTAAAVLLLARDGKLSIDDPVQKYIPELPDYGPPLTIRHVLTHTSGLRDWGSVEAIAGWPRASRAYTHAHVLDIVSHQKALNFAPGTRWSYSNTGFNLAAIIVSRVSGQSFAEFTRQRLFEPLGMTQTSWRDDFTHVLKRRAVAYAERGGEFHTDMPFENVYGNGGLLTTVGDLLKWNENFSTPKVGDAAFVAREQQAGALTNGRAIGYAFGLFLSSVHGIRIVEHSGSTAGYSAHLLRMPDQRISVAVLCNATTARATQYAHEVADALLPNHEHTGPDPASPLPPSTDLYRNVDNGLVLTSAPAGSTWSLDHGQLSVTDRYAIHSLFDRAPHAAPTAAQAQSLAGVYTSDEAETTLTVAVEAGAVVVKRRPDGVFPLRALYVDAFDAPALGTVIFRRDAAGRVAALSVVQDRVWDLRFTRQGLSRTTSDGAR
jgi:CubicO group peptidase (beta-lactamase class C family)